jgi:hypothetical protein
MSLSFSYIVQTFCINTALQFSLLPYLQIVNILHQTMVYAACIHTDLDTLQLKSSYSLSVFSQDVSSEFSKLFQNSSWQIPTSTMFRFLRLDLSISNFFAACLLTVSLSGLTKMNLCGLMLMLNSHAASIPNSVFKARYKTVPYTECTHGNMEEA